MKPHCLILETRVPGFLARNPNILLGLPFKKELLLYCICHFCMTRRCVCTIAPLCLILEKEKSLRVYFWDCFRRRNISLYLLFPTMHRSGKNSQLWQFWDASVPNFQNRRNRLHSRGSFSKRSIFYNCNCSTAFRRNVPFYPSATPFLNRKYLIIQSLLSFHDKNYYAIPLRQAVWEEPA